MLDLTETFNPLRTVWRDEVIGIIETRRNSAGSYDGGVVAYLDKTDTELLGCNCYTVHNYSVIQDDLNRVSLSNGDYRLTRRQAMERLLQRAQWQGEGMYDPTLG